MSLFLPKNEEFFDLFKELSQDLKDEAAVFAEVTAAFSNFEQCAKKAKDIEHAGDSKTHQIIDRLNKTFITPFDREDIYGLAHALDDIIDLIESTIAHMYLYKLPKKNAALDSFADIITQAAEALQQLLKHLENRKYSKELLGLKIKIHELEDQGDAVYEKSIAELLNAEPDPIVIIKYKDILQSLEDVVDKFQQVSDLIEGIVVKNS